MDEEKELLKNDVKKIKTELDSKKLECSKHLQVLFLAGFL